MNVDTENKDGISVVTIALNQKYFIESTIQSVISQRDDVNIEYIVIDGGSTDGTLEIINSYSKYIDHIVSGEDGGIYPAINKGIRLASFKLVGLIHCGDSYKAGALKRVYETFISSNADVIYGDIKFIDQAGDKEITTIARANHDLLEDSMSIFHPSTFITLAVYNELGLYDTSYRSAADYELLLRLYKKSAVFLHIPEVLAVFRVGGMSSRNFKLAVSENYRIRKKYQGGAKALRYFFKRSLIHYILTFRNFVFISLLGQSVYNKFKYKIRR